MSPRLRSVDVPDALFAHSKKSSVGSSAGTCDLIHGRSATTLMAFIVWAHYTGMRSSAAH